jgi:glyoxylase-like metal-dependent hydrolase (beta-lactamase superfamily II)
VFAYSRTGEGQARKPEVLVKEVVGGILMMKRSWGCNIYFIDGTGMSLVDAGFPLDTRRIARCLRATDGERLDVMVATHCHLDHMGSMARLKKRFGSRVIAHAADAPVMEGAVPYPTFKLEPLQAVYYKVLRPLYPYEFVEVDERVSEGDVVDIMGGLEVLHVPGHTPGSMALYQRERGVLFTGDTVRNENGVLDGPPPQFTPELERAYRCIEEKLMPLDFDVLLPGHGEPIVGGARQALASMLAGRMEAPS